MNLPKTTIENLARIFRNKFPGKEVSNNTSENRKDAETPKKNEEIGVSEGTMPDASKKVEDFALEKG